MGGWWGGGGMDDRPWLSEIITSIRSHLSFLFVKDRGKPKRGRGEMTKSKVCRKRLECFCLVSLMRSFTHDGTLG